MTERDFLHGIRAAPDDDAPRLIFADWLDEQDQHERAEFIRVQCELSRMPKEDTNRQLLERREQQLFISLPSGLPSKTIAKCFTMTRRGFIESVICDSADWRIHGPDIVARHPVQRVTPTNKRPHRWVLPHDAEQFSWLRGSIITAHKASADSIPFPWFDFMQSDNERYTVHFDTEQEGFDALSTALIRWALQEAGIVDPSQQNPMKIPFILNT